MGVALYQKRTNSTTPIAGVNYLSDPIVLEMKSELVSRVCVLLSPPCLGRPPIFPGASGLPCVPQLCCRISSRRRPLAALVYAAELALGWRPGRGLRRDVRADLWVGRVRH